MSRRHSTPEEYLNISRKRYKEAPGERKKRIPIETWNYFNKEKNNGSMTQSQFYELIMEKRIPKVGDRIRRTKGHFRGYSEVDKIEDNYIYFGNYSESGNRYDILDEWDFEPLETNVSNSSTNNTNSVPNNSISTVDTNSKDMICLETVQIRAKLEELENALKQENLVAALPPIADLRKLLNILFRASSRKLSQEPMKSLKRASELSKIGQEK
jgi:hypothetical protein